MFLEIPFEPVQICYTIYQKSKFVKGCQFEATVIKRIWRRA